MKSRASELRAGEEVSGADLQALMARAVAARVSAYARYSRFTVGAALLFKDGDIVSGFNVENASYGLTMCAERVALYAAFACGKRADDALALCVAGAPEDAIEPERLITPCGACRQVLNEFKPRMLVGCAAPGGMRTFYLDELLPQAFGSDDLA